MPAYLVTVKETVVYRLVVETASKEMALKRARTSYNMGELHKRRYKKNAEHKLEGIEVKEQKYTD